MRKVLLSLSLATTLLVPAIVSADHHEEKEDRFIYATYFYCKTATQEQADVLVKKNTAPIYDAAVADGTIKGWGWLSHHTGGKWRRIQYHVSDTVSGLLKAQETIAGRIDKAMDGADDGFAEICGGHEDYIWESKNGSSSDTARGKASLSVYHVCSFSGEERADEIVGKVFAPVYNKAVADGKITSWGWNAHVVGGKYRRLSTMSADNYDDLLAAWGEILDSIYGDGENAEANEFSEICTSHSDYLWDVVHEKS